MYVDICTSIIKKIRLIKKENNNNLIKHLFNSKKYI